MSYFKFNYQKKEAIIKNWLLQVIDSWKKAEIVLKKITVETRDEKFEIEMSEYYEL